MRKVYQVVGVAIIGVSLGLVLGGCSNSDKDKMKGNKTDDKMKDDKLKDDKMKDDKMKDDKMKDDKMKDDKMKDDKMKDDKMKDDKMKDNKMKDDKSSRLIPPHQRQWMREGNQSLSFLSSFTLHRVEEAS